MNVALHQSLHSLEAQIIEINGLMSALQTLLPDGAAHTCVANAIEDKLKGLDQLFSEHWAMLESPNGKLIARTYF